MRLQELMMWSEEESSFRLKKMRALDFFTTGHTKEEIEKYLDQYSPFLPGKDEKERESLVKEMFKGGSGLTRDAIQAKFRG
ncbi:MAG: hypothetical protein R3C24_09135 [Cyanobacteriota/Melainabacteria group bacterium]